LQIQDILQAGAKTSEFEDQGFDSAVARDFANLAGWRYSWAADPQHRSSSFKVLFAAEEARKIQRIDSVPCFVWVDTKADLRTYSSRLSILKTL